MPKPDNDLDAAQTLHEDMESTPSESFEKPRVAGGAIDEFFGNILPVGRAGELKADDKEGQSGGSAVSEDAGLRLFLTPKDIASLSNKFDSTFQRFESAKTLLESKVAERTGDLVNVQRRLELIIDSISDAVITFDDKGIIGSFSRSAETIFGYSDSQVIDQPITGVVPSLCVNGEESQTIEGTLGVKADGTPIRIEGVVRLMTFNQKNLYVATVRDITAQHRTQKLLEEQAFLIEKSKSFVLVTNAKNQVDWCNPCFEDLTGYKKSQLIGKRPFDLLLCKTTDESAVNMIRDACHRRESYSAEVIFIHETGRPFWVQIEAHPMFTDDGALDKYVALGVDVTEQKQHEAQQADFVSMVSHELRTPLTVVSGALDALEMSLSKLPSEMEQSLVKMGQRNCAQLSTLIEDLLDINKLEAGVVRFQSQLIDVSEPIRDGIRTVATLADDAGITVSATYCEHEVSVFLDPQRLLQVIVNLLSNAVKFSKPGGDVQLALSSDDKVAKIEVTDQGLGIPLAFQDKVFERFARDPEVQAMGTEGFGLGLSICKGLVELMDGKIYFVSTEGEGTTFTLEVPLSHEESESGGPAEKSPVEYEYDDQFGDNFATEGAENA